MKGITTITMCELIARTHSSYDAEIRDYEAKRNGDPEVDHIIDRLTEPLRQKCDTLELMFEIETGKSMFAD